MKCIPSKQDLLERVKNNTDLANYYLSAKGSDLSEDDLIVVIDMIKAAQRNIVDILNGNYKSATPSKWPD